MSSVLLGEVLQNSAHLFTLLPSNSLGVEAVFRAPLEPGYEALLHGDQGMRAPGACRPSTGCRGSLPRWFMAAGSRERRPWAQPRCGLGKGKPPPLLHECLVLGVAP